MSQEEWRKVKDYPDYEVSNSGHVRNIVTNKVLKGSVQKRYNRVAIRNIDGSKTLKVHRLVAFAFLGEPSAKDMTVNHKNYNTLDNRVENLEWMTVQDNVMHGKKFGRCTPVGIGHMATLTIYTYHLANYPNRHPICTKAFGISGASYESIVSGKTRKKLYFEIFDKCNNKYKGEHFERSIFSE